MKFKIILSILVQFVCTITNGQDKELLKQYVLKQFEVRPSIEITYTSRDFSANSTTEAVIDELSLKKVEELKDSFEISNNINCLRRIGEIYYRLGNVKEGTYYLQEAAKKYQEKLVDNPSDEKLLENLSLIYVRLGELLPAIELADEILDINPTDSFAIFTNIYLYLSIGDLASAKEYCNKAIDFFPQHAETYLYRTLILISDEYLTLNQSENFEGFKSDFSYLQKAADSCKNNSKVQLASLCLKLAVLQQQIMLPYFYHPPKSVKNFRFKLTATDSLELEDYKSQYFNMIESEEYNNPYILYYSLGIISTLEGDYYSAVDFFQKSIDLRKQTYPHDADVLGSYNNVIFCYFHMADTLNAKKWTEMKMEDKVAHNNLSENYVELARYYLIEGNLAKGEELLNKAISIDSTTFEAYVDLANIQLINNNVEQAERNLDKCFKINPDCIELQKSFILLTLYQGDFTTAKFLVNRFKNVARDKTFALDIERDFLN